MGGRGRGGGGGPRRRVPAPPALVVAASLGTVGYGLWEAATPRVVETTARIGNLPAGFDGVRVVLVTDVHAGPARGEGFVRKVVDLVAEQDPDVVVFGGEIGRAHV